MQNTDEYYNKKMELLSQILTCSEDIMSSINKDEWESYGKLGDARVAAIEEMNRFEEDFRSRFDSTLSDAQRKAINDKVQLILGFEKDIVTKLEEEKQMALKGMSTESNEDKILNSYVMPGSNAVTGVFLDTKK